MSTRNINPNSLQPEYIIGTHIYNTMEYIVWCIYHVIYIVQVKILSTRHFNTKAPQPEHIIGTHDYKHTETHWITSLKV